MGVIGGVLEQEIEQELDVGRTHGRARYSTYWGTEFWEPVRAALADADAVLDVGSGRRPTIEPAERPRHVMYVGLDVSAEELSRAPRGAYDETVAADAKDLVAELVDRFDLIVSWQVLEHVKDLSAAAANFHAYARPGGKFVAMLSGRYAAHAVANRFLPTGLARRFVARLRGRPVDTVFSAYYDHCDERGLRDAFSSWETLEVLPLWRGADYFERLPGLLPLYLRYEDFAIRRGWTQSATNYVVVATKD
jgi:SAM-dependent methyltransferase